MCQKSGPQECGLLSLSSISSRVAKSDPTKFCPKLEDLTESSMPSVTVARGLGAVHDTPDEGEIVERVVRGSSCVIVDVFG